MAQSAKRIDESEQQLSSKGRIFNIEDQLIGDYLCALRRNILYQGKLYLFEQNVCFTSTILGTDIKLTIPIKNIAKVYKQTYMGFPNTLKMEVLDVSNNQMKKYYFSSFLQRDEVYTRLLELKNQKRNWLESSEQLDGLLSPSSNDNQSQQSQYFIDASPAPLKHKGSEKILEAPEDIDDAKFQESPKSPFNKKTEQTFNNENQGEPETDFLENNKEEFKDGFPWVNSKQAPDPPSDMELIASDELSCSLTEYWSLFQSNSSDYNKRVRLKEGCNELEITNWNNDDLQEGNRGLVRRIVMVTAEKHMMIQANIQSVINQSCKAYKDHLIINQVQTSTGAPLVDTFQNLMQYYITQYQDGTKSMPTSPLSIKSDELPNQPQKQEDKSSAIFEVKNSFNNSSNQYKVRIVLYYKMDVLKKSVFSGKIYESSKSRITKAFNQAMIMAKEDLLRAQGKKTANDSLNSNKTSIDKYVPQIVKNDRELLEQLKTLVPAEYHKQITRLFSQYQQKNYQVQSQDAPVNLQNQASQPPLQLIQNQNSILQIFVQSLDFFVKQFNISMTSDQALQTYLVLCLLIVFMLQIVYLSIDGIANQVDLKNQYKIQQQQLSQYR